MTTSQVSEWWLVHQESRWPCSKWESLVCIDTILSSLVRDLLWIPSPLWDLKHLFGYTATLMIACQCRAAGPPLTTSFLFCCESDHSVCSILSWPICLPTKMIEIHLQPSFILFAGLPPKLSSGRPLLFVPGRLAVLISLSS